MDMKDKALIEHFKLYPEPVRIGFFGIDIDDCGACGAFKKQMSLKDNQAYSAEVSYEKEMGLTFSDLKGGWDL